MFFNIIIVNVDKPVRYHYKITQRGNINFEKVFQLGSIFFYVCNIIYIILYIQDLHMNNKIEQRVSGIYKTRTYSSVSARDLDIGPEGRYHSRADDKGNMKKAMY
jgi:hypothetical protein